MSNVVDLKPRPRKLGILTVVREPRTTLPSTLDIAEQLKARMVGVGIVPPDDIVYEHGKMQRFASSNSSRKRDGWYVLFIHDTHIACAFGSWRTGAKYKLRFEPAENLRP